MRPCLKTKKVIWMSSQSYYEDSVWAEEMVQEITGLLYKLKYLSSDL